MTISLSFEFFTSPRYPFAAKSSRYYTIILIMSLSCRTMNHVRAGTFSFPLRAFARPKSPPSKSSISPTYDRFTSNSFVSPAYAKTGGVPPQKCRRADICSLFSPNPHSRLFLLSITWALFHFPYHTYPLSLQHLPHSFPKSGGYPTLVTPIPPRLLARHSPLHPSAR